MILAGLALFAPLVAGAAAWRRNGWSASLGGGLALGLLSLLYFWVRLLWGRWDAALVALEILLVGALAYWGWRGRSPDPKTYVLGALAFLGFTVAGASLVIAYEYHRIPQGAWDAWAIWNQRAAFLHRTSEDWIGRYRLLWHGHPDYPLLLPTLVAWGWDVLDSEPTWLPLTVALVFLVLTAGLVFEALRPADSGWAAGLVLAPAFAWKAVQQQADLPLAFFFTATLIALTRATPSAWLVAGLSAGLAAWTKNEGLLFVFLVLGLGLLWPPHPKARVWLLAGVVVPLATCLVFKLGLPRGGNDLMVALPERAGLVLDPQRWARLGAWILDLLLRASNWRHFLPFVVLPLLWWVRGPDRLTSGQKLAVATVFLTLTGYLIIYLTTPHDLDWHLQTSHYRLAAQVWPGCVFLTFLTSQPKEVEAS